MLTLPKELEIADLSALGICDQSELDIFPGESGIFILFEELKIFFRVGIVKPRLPIIGEESGDDFSARVEW